MSFFRSINRNKSLKFSGIFLSMAMMGQNASSADFEGIFAPGNWTYTETSPVAHTLNSTQLQITSSNDGNGPNYAQYAIYVPLFVTEFSFNYNYVTADVSNSSFDEAQYVLDGTAVNLHALIPQDLTDGLTETEAGSWRFTGVGGSSFAIKQNASDSALGSATITITNFRYRISIPNQLRLVTTPTLSQSGNTMSCSPGTYKFLNGGSTEEAQNLGGLVYTLVVDGKAVSRLGAGSYTNLPSHLFPAITQSVSGSADMKGASWDVSALKNFDARCEIYAWQSGGNIQSFTAQISDAVKTAEIAAMAKAREEERAAANAANFTKEAREMRKRIAARSGK